MSDNKFDMVDYATRVFTGKSASSPAMNTASPVQMVMGAVEVAQKRLAEKGAQPVGNMIGEFPAMNTASPTELSRRLRDYANQSWKFSNINVAKNDLLALLDELDRRAAPVGQGSAQTGEAFRAHLAKCSAEVATWPAWKRRGGFDQGSATSGEAASNDLNILESCALWLDGRSGTVWARDFGHTELMAQYARRLREIRAALAASAGSARAAAVIRRYDMGISVDLVDRSLPDGARLFSSPVAEQPNTPVPRVGGNTCEILQIQYANGNWTDVGPRTYAEVEQDGGAVRKLYTTPVAERAAAPASVPEGWTVEVVGDAIHIKRADGKWAGVMPEIGPAHALIHEFLTALLAAPEVAQPAAQGESIDTPEFWKLADAYGRAGASWLDDASAALVAYVLEWGASQRQEVRIEGWDGAVKLYASNPPAPTAGEASARTDDDDDDMPISRSTYGSLAECEAEQARRDAIKATQGGKEGAA